MTPKKRAERSSLTQQTAMDGSAPSFYSIKRGFFYAKMPKGVFPNPPKWSLFFLYPKTRLSKPVQSHVQFRDSENPFKGKEGVEIGLGWWGTRGT